MENAHKLTKSETIELKIDIRVLDIVEIQKGKPCVITESTSGQISFVSLAVPDAKGDSDTNRNPIMEELNDQVVTNNKDKQDPIKKLISMIFLAEETGEYKQCGVALHHSGCLEFIWNYRIVDSFPVGDIVETGFVDDIASNFGFIYYKQVNFEMPKSVQD
jgi:hypothetical protein